MDDVISLIGDGRTHEYAEEMLALYCHELIARAQEIVAALDARGHAVHFWTVVGPDA